MTAMRKRTVRRRQVLALLGGFVLAASATLGAVTSVGAGAEDGATEVPVPEVTTTLPEVTTTLPEVTTTTSEETTTTSTTTTTGASPELAASEVDPLAPPTDCAATTPPTNGWLCSINPAHVNPQTPSTNPGFGTKPDDPTTPENECLNSLAAPAPPNDWGWHFIAPGNNNNFFSLSATFGKSGASNIVFTNIAPTGANSAPTSKHMFLFTPQGYTLLSASAVIIGATDPGKFNLSHVCPGTTAVTTGSLNVTKTVSGTPASGTTFTIEVNCDDGTEHDRTVALGSQLVFNTSLVNTGPGTLPITGIPATTSCVVTEPNNGGATSVVIATSPAVITAGGTATVNVTNTFIAVGGNITVRLDVNKEIVGSVLPANNTKFVVNVSCTGATSVNQDLTFTYPSPLGVQSIIRDIPASGTLTCTVTETNSGGALLKGYKINAGAVQGGATVTLDVSNPDDAVTVVNDPSGGTGGIEVAGTSASRALATTGSDTGTLLHGAVALLGIGIAALLGTRRRRPAVPLG